MSPREVVLSHLINAVPERSNEIRALWQQYNPDIIVEQNSRCIKLQASMKRIVFEPKTMQVFWLICFSGWKAIECYSPHVKRSVCSDKTIDTLMQADDNDDSFEIVWRQRLAAAKELIQAEFPECVPWPSDVPFPNDNRNAFTDPQHLAAFDLTCLAVAFTLFHEFRHVMFGKDKDYPSDRREEELACDVWAREFMTAKLATYVQEHNHNYYRILRKRSIGFALAALIIHEITPVIDHGGNNEYFSIATRLQAILDNTSLPDNDHFWVVAASILVGIFRQKGLAINTSAANAKLLTNYLLDNL